MSRALFLKAPSVYGQFFLGQVFLDKLYFLVCQNIDNFSLPRQARGQGTVALFQIYSRVSYWTRKMCSCTARKPKENLTSVYKKYFSL